MDIDRRTFLKGAALASAAGLAPAAAGEAAVTQHGPVWQRAPCALCGVGCMLGVAVRDGRAIAARGDVESPVNRGLACVKGYHAIQLHYGSDRITQPLVRRSGRLVPTSLADAYDMIAVRLRAVLTESGADAAATYGTGAWSVADAYIAAKLFKAGIGTNNVDTSARLFNSAASTGLRATYGMDGAPGCYDDIEHADAFVLWGHNMSETDPVLFSRVLQRRRTNPAVRIITVGTRTTRTSYAADRNLLHLPGTEIALANAVCHELVRRRRVDRDFIARHVSFARGRVQPGDGSDERVVLDDDVGGATFDEFTRFLQAYAAESAAALTGIAADDIGWLASVYGDRSRKVLSLWGSELNQHARGTWLNNVLHNIHLLVGRVASPGNGALCCTAQPSGSDAVHAAGAAPAALPAGDVRNEDDRQHAARLWGVPAAQLAGTPGRTALSMFRGVESGAIRFLWVHGSDPLVDLPNCERYRRALRRGTSFLVVTDAYPTATTEVADVVLPASLWLEREGVLGSGERRTQHVPRLLRGPAHARTDGWHMIEVARRLGFGALFPWSEAMHAHAAWDELARFHVVASRRPARLPDLRGRGGHLWPHVDGRDTRWRYNTAHDPAAGRERGAYDFYGHTDHRAKIWLRPHEPPAEVPDRSYPFRLATGRVLEHACAGSLTRRIPVLHRAAPRAWAELHPDDARALGIAQGERIRLVTRRGALELEARVNHRTQPQRGMVFVPAFDESAPANRLTGDACCPLSGQPATSSCAVRVERIA
jgi:nitrate reductase (cytochrome)